MFGLNLGIFTQSFIRLSLWLAAPAYIFHSFEHFKFRVKFEKKTKLCLARVFFLTLSLLYMAGGTGIFDIQGWQNCQQC
jgi:hypothetical protein